MKEDELTKLEESRDVKRILEASKALYDKDKAENAPRSFDSLMKQIEQREQTSRKMAISPWWLAAACLIGILIGWNFSFDNAPKDDKLAVNDTVIITEKHTDTIYQQVQVAVKKLERKERREVTYPQTMQAQKVLPPVMTSEIPLPDPRSSRPATSGRSLSQEDFPVHLLVSL
ncbi:hypothetical protein [uncultured Bacteroides sp.]|uniref:hypothetical protein n=1 Tax=uncultured Bacteroides sp. TaxID=162156 RepID=UPI002AAB97AB|nr:hypothetical protein [uncultured Bacteroides sp.]